VYVVGLGEKHNKNLHDSDTLSSICFDKTGENLAVGDEGGRVIIFRYSDLKSSRYFDYRYLFEI
jgi:hypothetical protein